MLALECRVAHAPLARILQRSIPGMKIAENRSREAKGTIIGPKNPSILPFL
jgi:hypothetical protein